MNYRKIPCPISFPLFGTLPYYLPLIGPWKFDTLHINGQMKYKKFGKIVREEIIPGTEIVWLFDPEDIKILFLNESKYPKRRSHLALEYYRLNNTNYKNGGLLPTNGPEWFRLRSAFQKGISVLSDVQSYLPISNEIAQEWIYLFNIKNSSIDFSVLLAKLFLELIFDIRLNGFSGTQAEDLKSIKLLKAALTVNDCILKTDNGLHLWKYYKTPMYKKLEKGHQEIDNLSLQFLSQKLSKYDLNKTPKTILENYLHNENVDIKDILGITSDFLLAGSDTTTYTASFFLYHLATNIEKQNNLYNESRKLLLKPDTEITKDVISNAKYAKASLKETLRLNPISVGIGRILTKDSVFSGYHVPKDTIIVTQNQVICRFEKYFKDANKFIPERWIRNTLLYQNHNPYLLLPFGHGARSCIARRLAEQNLLVFILKVIRNYEVYWNNGNLDCKTHLINKPNKPLDFIFKKRLC